MRSGLAFKRDWLARMGLRPENLSVIAANGESMAPTIHDGEVLLIATPAARATPTSRPRAARRVR